MAWADVHGEFWFWVAAAVLWLHAALSMYGAPRRVIAEARRDDGAAAFAADLVRYRLGRGRRLPTGLLPLRWPFLGGFAAYAVAALAASGDLSVIGVFTALAPPAAASLALEPKIGAALDRMRAAETEAEAAAAGSGGGEDAAAARAAFADALEQCWRVRLASVAIAVLATLAVGAVWRA